MKSSTEVQIDHNNTDVDVVVNFHTGRRPQVHGPPDVWSPGEPITFEVEAAYEGDRQFSSTEVEQLVSVAYGDIQQAIQDEIDSAW